MLASAPTGSGKTLAFLLPLIACLKVCKRLCIVLIPSFSGVLFWPAASSCHVQLSTVLDYCRISVMVPPRPARCLCFLLLVIWLYIVLAFCMPG